MSRKPWEVFPAFQPEYLIVVADILRRARDSAARDAKPHLGDKLCSLGLVAYERSCFALMTAAAKEHSSWLSVGFADNHFIIRVKGVPVRFYPGDEDLPIPARTLRIGHTERRSVELALGGLGAAGSIQCFRFEVVKGARGLTRSINFVQVGKHNERLASWPIPEYSEKPVVRAVPRGAVKLKPISLDDPQPNAKSGDATA